MDLSEIGSNIRKRRNELGLTLDELAERMGMNNKKTLSVWENSDVNEQYPKLNNIVKLSEALDCDPEHLLGFSKTPHITTSWIAEQLPLDSEAIELLQESKKACERSEEAQYIADLISFFIKALLGDICGGDGISLGVALAELSHFYAEEQFLENEKIEDLFSHESRMLRTNIIACKEEVREAATKVLTQFCKDRPFESAQVHNEPVVTLPLEIFNEMIQSEMLNAYLDDDMDRIEELKNSGKAFNLKWEVEDNGNI